MSADTFSKICRSTLEMHLIIYRHLVECITTYLLKLFCWMSVIKVYLIAKLVPCHHKALSRMHIGSSVCFTYTWLHPDANTDRSEETTSLPDFQTLVNCPTKVTKTWDLLKANRIHIISVGKSEHNLMLLSSLYLEKVQQLPMLQIPIHPLQN